MTIRWYVFPVEEIVQGGTTYRGPKYLKWRMNPTGIDARWSMVDYGLMPTALLVGDVTAAQHTQAATQPDIVVIPENIDNAIGSIALPIVVSELEALHIPANWVTTTHTYREVMRRMAHLFQLAQRYHGRTAKKLIESGFNLNTFVSTLPINVRTSLNEAAQSLGWDTSMILGSWTLRQALLYLADQWGSTPVLFGNLAEL
jgi:hypothetical protein